MRVKTIIDEDFINYKKPSMFIAACNCDFKCCKEGGFDVSVCQNSPISQMEDVSIKMEDIFKRYINNPISQAIVIGGLEPMLQFESLTMLISYFRFNGCKDEFVIYTGYYKDEILDKVRKLKYSENVIIKYGRYIPNHKPHFDEILGVELASDNQYAERLS